MKEAPMPPETDLIALALAEDIGWGDVTSRYFVGGVPQAAAHIVARESCVLSGIGVAEEVFRRVDSLLQVRRLADDGAELSQGEAVLEVKGTTASILTAERTALNFLQCLSGVATLTRRYVEAIRGTAARILDTRKTTPGWRGLEKAAVLAGGGTNHRFGLYDMVMVKDNHLAGGTGSIELQAAIRRVKTDHPGMRVELEADTLDQVRVFANLEGVDVILLDNMPLAAMREAVSLRKPGLLFEASGGVNLETVREIAETGVDFISVGALTHSPRAVDFSLEMDGGPG
jgi:nicotinate-nucleotide pyrophosphorylase (carboxylating)